ncbi:MAG: DoxX family protein [SAR324 cluster bacterium]|nr:DoxX family protein [SAR324 cluster bacterium]
MEFLVDIGRIMYGATLLALGLNNYLKLEKKVHLAESKGIPFPKESVILSTAIIVLGGFLIMINSWVGIGVLCVWIFLIPATLKVHNFWTLEEGVPKEIDMLHFVKNIALLGASLSMLGLS